jgi:uncharacterized integral membrane protein
MRDRAGRVWTWAVRLAIVLVLVAVVAMIAVGAAQLDFGAR